MTARDLRIVFAGTPDFAAVHLACLIREGFLIVSAYSQPDRPTGRGKKLLPTSVKALAQVYDIPVLQPASFTAEALAELAALQPDLLIVVAYGLLLPESVLALPRFGCINVHASLLPRWRGAAPIERAILAGDKETGICIMQMDKGLDTGPVLSRAAVPIHEDDSSETLTLRLQQLGCEQLARVLEQLAAGTARPVAQNDALACYAHKLRKEEAEIDWNRSATHIHNQVRAFYPRSPAWCRHQDQRLRILSTQALADPHNNPSENSPPGTVLSMANGTLLIACKPGILAVNKVQPEGKNAMTLPELLNGRPDFFKPGTVLMSAVHAPAS